MRLNDFWATLYFGMIYASCTSAKNVRALAVIMKCYCAVVLNLWTNFPLTKKMLLSRNTNPPSSFTLGNLRLGLYWTRRVVETDNSEKRKELKNVPICVRWRPLYRRHWDSPRPLFKFVLSDIDSFIWLWHVKIARSTIIAEHPLVQIHSFITEGSPSSG
jgi:hypothetical protein